MEESSLRILAQAGLSGVFFAAKILRGELPHYRLPLPEFAAKILPCSAPLRKQKRSHLVRGALHGTTFAANSARGSQ